jgi:hypothetical protein
VAGSAVAASGDEGASWVAPGSRGPSYGSRIPTSDAAATIQIPGLTGIGKLQGSG